jgi:hypothetical protein
MNLAAAEIRVSRNFLHKVKVIRILFIIFYHSTKVNNRCQWKTTCIFILVFSIIYFQSI